VEPRKEEEEEEEEEEEGPLILVVLGSEAGYVRYLYSDHSQ
jgi:hypothetical protein